MSEIREIARGHWRDILPKFGIDEKFLVNRHGPCPLCGGKDRWRFDDKSGTGSYYCTSCGSGDGFMLINKVSKSDFIKISQEIKGLVTGLPAKVKKQDERPTPGQSLARMKTLWDSCQPVTSDCATGKYMLDRLGQIFDRPGIRHGEVYHHETRSRMPAMVCKVASVTGQPVNLHLTFLTPDGRKASISPNKRVMQGSLPEGCAARLARITNTTIGIAEGIETALSSELLFGIQTWSAVNAVCLSRWLPPPDIEEVFVFSDNDVNYTGQAKAYALANRLSMRGFSVKVMVPPEPGQDWNDVLVKKMGA